MECSLGMGVEQWPGRDLRENTNPMVRLHDQYRKCQKVPTSCEDLVHINATWLICCETITLKLLADLLFIIVRWKKLSFQGSFHWSNGLTYMRDYQIPRFNYIHTQGNTTHMKRVINFTDSKGSGTKIKIR